MDLRVGVYAVITDDQGRMLLPHWRDEGIGTGWTLPGGGMEPGEHPADTAVREVLEETGYDVELGEILGVDSAVIPGDRRKAAQLGTPLQALRIIYRAHITGGSLRVEQGGSTDDVAWFRPEEIDELHRVGLVDVARRQAGLLTSV
ncbi:NUDIX hydrolase [Nesterenkonia suensis]